MTDVLSREQRCALLAEAGREELVALADECLADGAPVRVLTGPEVGAVAAQVREPVLAERFLLGDVLACRAEVEVAGQRGWSMRLGDDRAATWPPPCSTPKPRPPGPSRGGSSSCAVRSKPAAPAARPPSGPSSRPPSSSSRS